jgi:adenine deaminase
LLFSRQASLLGKYPTAIRRFSDKPRLNSHSTSIILGSKPNGLPPGIAVHAELLALVESGMIAGQALRTAGVNAATALGVNLQIGRIAPGSSADLILVDGDPLSDIKDVQNIVGVVRNGRFFSVIGLIERVEKANSVE